MKTLYKAAFYYVILGLGFGLFYREFTVFYQFDGLTALSTLHVHTLVLGFIFHLVLLSLDLSLALSSQKQFKFFFWFYQISLHGLLATLTWRGILDVLGTTMVGLNHLAGLFHTTLAISLVLWMILIGKALQQKQSH